MVKKDIKQTVQELLIQADIQINGKRSWDIKVINQGLYSRLLAGGILAIGEAYVGMCSTGSIGR
jgi:cyclopropane-fatty-acyl-phospholipid synthase